VSSGSFYGEYYGHTTEQLESVLAGAAQSRPVCYLVGDSTLDNKHWLGRRTVPASNGYESVLRPPRSKPDVAHCMNEELVRRGHGEKLLVVNCAVEESTLGERAAASFRQSVHQPAAGRMGAVEPSGGARSGSMLAQDAFVRSRISERDVLVVSCGGNDIALRPTLWTIVAMCVLLLCPKWLIRTGWAPGLGHFVRLFRDGTRRYISSLVAECKPRAVVVCMLYYLDEKACGSWADTTLRAVGYDRDPSKLQLGIRKMFELGTSRVAVDGVDVIPCALYEALDGKDSADYRERVEPSESGGRKMARLVVDCLARGGVLE